MKTGRELYLVIRHTITNEFIGRTGLSPADAASVYCSMVRPPRMRLGSVRPRPSRRLRGGRLFETAAEPVLGPRYARTLSAQDKSVPEILRPRRI